MKEYLTKEQTDKLFNAITSNGCREMEETRFHQAVNEAINISIPMQAGVKPANNGLLIEVPKLFYDSLIECSNKLLDAYEKQDQKMLMKYKAGLRILLNR